LPAEMVKNRQAIEMDLPKTCTDLIVDYVARGRPVLSDQPGPWLFPGERPNSAKSLDQFSRLYSKTIRRQTGLDVNLHLMRHICAYLYLDHNPGAYEVVRQVLGHRAMSTTVNAYTGLETEAAFRHFDQTILRIRDGVMQEAGNGT
ncbi:MAG: tyrosine-type recombinase/integrase, partial [Rhodospirillales bacterium]|nr:tyrosine-type recombinase/integrase [Rhodospirillales bacterium]